MELLQFVFSSFWVFIGFILLIGVILEGLEGILKGIAEVIYVVRSDSESQNNKNEDNKKEESYTEADYEVVDE